MNVAIMCLAFREQETIGAVLKNWQGLVKDIYVFIGQKPWHWEDQGPDRTKEIAIKHHAIVVEDVWINETDERNDALDMLAGYDYVLIVDADELYENPKQILDSLKGEACYRANKVTTYWKTTDYVLTPADRHKPIIAVDPKRIKFKEFRIPNTDWQPVIDIEMHHLSYCKSDQKILEKIHQFEHHNQIKPNWYKEKWLEWRLETENIHPYNRENHKAIYKPLPEELKKLI